MSILLSLLPGVTDVRLSPIGRAAILLATGKSRNGDLCLTKILLKKLIIIIVINKNMKKIYRFSQYENNSDLLRGFYQKRGIVASEVLHVHGVNFFIAGDTAFFEKENTVIKLEVEKIKMFIGDEIRFSHNFGFDSVSLYLNLKNEVQSIWRNQNHDDGMSTATIGFFNGKVQSQNLYSEEIAELINFPEMVNPSSTNHYRLNFKWVEDAKFVFGDTTYRSGKLAKYLKDTFFFPFNWRKLLDKYD